MASGLLDDFIKTGYNTNMISVVLATHNEEANIEKVLLNIKSFADEVIIADGESTDKTVQIAKKHGAKVFSVKNHPIFHVNKQRAMDKANGDLVLQLDADEIVDEELEKFIQKINSPTSHKISDQPVAWYLKRKNFFLGKFLTKGGQYPDPVIRLYRNGHARLPQKSVHEQMVVDGAVATADGHLLHYSNPTFSDYMRKWNTYTSLTATELQMQHSCINTKLILKFMFWKPMTTFFSLFIRHKGFVDGTAGFVFALMSGLHFPAALLKFWESTHARSA
ncbi:MAG: glycosyltransferase family 2 protein [Microgenomates group bacterium]